MLVHLLLISVRLAPYLILINIKKPTRGASRLIDFENNLGEVFPPLNLLSMVGLYACDLQSLLNDPSLSLNILWKLTLCQ